MKVLITGATGFIGRHLISVMLEQGCEIIAVSRVNSHEKQKLPAAVEIIDWDNNRLRAALESADAVINLAGESISTRPWNNSRKTMIMNSRLLAAQRLQQALGTVKNKPGIFIQASAIGFYGNQFGRECSEMCPAGEGFLAEVCSRWENHVPELETMLERVITIRIGVVLGRDGGIMKELLKQSKRHTAGVVGTGKQWISWIHMYDLVYAILYLLNNDKAKGIFNLVAPKPLQQAEFSKLIRHKSGSGIQFPAPGFMIRLLLGEFGKELLLSGQKVAAGKLIRQGFLFKYTTAPQAIENILDPLQK